MTTDYGTVTNPFGMPRIIGCTLIQHSKNNNMKKTIQLTVALLIGTTMAFATNPEDPEAKKVKVTKERTGVYNVAYKMSEPSKVQVLILNKEGVTVHRETLNSTKSFTRSYNLTNFSSGDYTFQINDANNSSTATITYDKSQGIVLYKMGDTHKVKLIAAVPNQKLQLISMIWQENLSSKTE